MKKTLSFLAASALMAVALSGCAGNVDPAALNAGDNQTGGSSGGQVVNVFNWGEYIDTDVLTAFEEKTGIEVNYTMFDTNESLYSKLKTESYDVVIPSDYMIARMIEEGMLQKINFDHIPNYEDVDPAYKNLAYDPTNEYSVPYTWGTVGIIYNKDKVDEADLGSWDILWNPKYKGQTVMFDNARDAMGLTLKSLGYSLNTTDETELREAAKKIKSGKNNFQGFWMDQILEKLPSGEAWIAPYYAGDAVTMIEEAPNLGFFVPEEGTNMFVDAMCVPANAQNVENAEAFINFMCETEIAKQNIEYIGYSTPLMSVKEALDDEITDNPIAYPDAEVLANTETFINLPEETNMLYDALWSDILK